MLGMYLAKCGRLSMKNEYTKVCVYSMMTVMTFSYSIVCPVSHYSLKLILKAYYTVQNNRLF